MGKLVFQLTGAFAEFERTMIKAGLKRAVAQGVKLGRPKIDSATERKLRKQLAKGVGILKVAKSLGLDRHGAAHCHRYEAFRPAQKLRCISRLSAGHRGQFFAFILFAASKVV